MELTAKQIELINKVKSATLTTEQMQMLIDKAKELLQNKPKIKP